MKKALFILSSLIFITSQLLAQEVTVTYSGGVFSPTIASLDAANIDTLIVVSSTATDYLTLSDLQSIRDKSPYRNCGWFCHFVYSCADIGGTFACVCQRYARCFLVALYGCYNHSYCHSDGLDYALPQKQRGYCKFSRRGIVGARNNFRTQADAARYVRLVVYLGHKNHFDCRSHLWIFCIGSACLALACSSRLSLYLSQNRYYTHACHRYCVCSSDLGNAGYHVFCKRWRSGNRRSGYSVYFHYHCLRSNFAFSCHNRY